MTNLDEEVDALQATKWCSRCQQSKPTSDFHRRVRSKDGLAVWCKPCASDNARVWRELNVDRMQASRAEWKAENKARIAETERARYLRNRDEILARGRLRYAADPGKHRETRRRWYEANKEVIAEKAAQYRVENKDRIRQWIRDWEKRHPEAQLRRNHARRAAVVGYIDAAHLASIWTGTCALCDREMNPYLEFPDPMSKSIDHIIPVSRGGSHAKGNLQWAHLGCNRRKGNRI